MPEFLKLMEKWDGYTPVRQARLSEAALARFNRLMANADRLPAHQHEYLLRETITTADFPALFGGTLDHILLARYRTAPSPWRAYTKVGRCRDFRVRDIHKVAGNDTVLAQVREKEEYPIAAMAASLYNISVLKYGRQFDISWESIVNDFLDAFGDVPQRFAQAAIDSEARHVTSLYCGAAAPAAALFGAPIVDVDGGAVTNLGILPLTIANLGAVLLLMAQQTDVNGRPLGIRGVHLVVPPALELTARQILTSAFMQQVDTAGGANAVPPTFVPLPTVNVLPQMGLQLHIDPWIPIVMPVAAANRTWFVFADPAQGPAFEMDFLAGHESPEICMKASNKVTVGGGALDPMSGDFESDDIKYRVRHCFGGTALDPRFAYAQVGP
ncbi:MAG: phage major capsid protein [Chloroflexota bacterium]